MTFPLENRPIFANIAVEHSNRETILEPLKCTMVSLRSSLNPQNLVLSIT